MSNMRNYLVAVLSVGLTICIAGCPEKDDKEFKPAEKKKIEEKHKHKPGPHGGDIVDLGNHEFRAEIVFKEKERELAIYLLDHDKDDPVFSKDKEIVVHFKHDGKEIEAKLPAVPQEGDKEGMTSRFQAKGDALPKELQDHHDLDGGHFNVDIMVKDKVRHYSAKIEGHDHDEDHKDDHDKHKDHKDDDKDHKKK